MAILVEAASVPGAADWVACWVDSDAAGTASATGAASFEGGSAFPVAVILVSSTGAAVSPGAVAASLFAGLSDSAGFAGCAGGSETGVSNFAGSSGDEASGFNAAIFSG
jgi:hypothetical protein